MSPGIYLASLNRPLFSKYSWVHCSMNEWHTHNIWRLVSNLQLIFKYFCEYYFIRLLNNTPSCIWRETDKNYSLSTERVKSFILELKINTFSSNMFVCATCLSSWRQLLQITGNKGLLLIAVWSDAALFWAAIILTRENILWMNYMYADIGF